MTLYDYTVKNNKGEQVSLSAYKGQTLLIVNTATGCGFTPQYKGLQDLYDTYKDQGFTILDFPCNQFGDQAPGSAAGVAAPLPGHPRDRRGLRADRGPTRRTPGERQR